MQKSILVQYAIILALGRKDCILVGHDWGGGIGYGFSDRYPEMVRAFVVCNCPHYRALRQAQRNAPEQIFKSWYMGFFQVRNLMFFNIILSL